MGKHYGLTKTPKFIENILSKFRKWKLSFYKKKKIRQDKTFRDRNYYVKFLIAIDDPINPQEMSREYEMILPAKAAFFAKRKAKQSIKKKIRVHFKELELVSDEDYEEYEKSKEDYIKEKGL
jgi:hypothetical protein